MKKEEIEKRIKRTKEIMLPVFVSQVPLRSLEDLPKEMKKSIEILLSHWTVYQKNLRKVLLFLSESPLDKEELREIEGLPLYLEKSLEEVEERMSILGRKITEKFLQLERILLEEKTESFNGIYQEVCKASFVLLFTSKTAVEEESLKIISDALNRVYSSLILCERIRQGLLDKKPKWVSLQSIFLYKELYSQSSFNLNEYLLLYKSVDQAIEEQRGVVIRIEKANTICSDFLAYFQSTIYENSSITKSIQAYERNTAEEKIKHHEENIAERRKEIESFLEREKD